MTIDEARNRSDFKKNDIIIDCEFNDSTQFNIANSVILKLKEKGVSRDILIVLYFCLYEAMDNTIQHGKINHGHIIVALDKGKIRILIYDEGVGVYVWLNNNRKSDMLN